MELNSIKERALILVAFVLVWGATGKSQDHGTLLSQTVTGVDASSSATVNAALVPGFLLKGTVTGDSSSIGETVTAISASGTFVSQVNQTTHTYRIILPADTYNLNVSFNKTSGPYVTSFTFQDSTGPVTVSADTIHNISLPSVTEMTFTGNVSNLNASLFSQTLTFDSTTISGFIDVSGTTSLSLGNYTAALPSGTFNVKLSQSAFSTIPPSSLSSSTVTSNLGSHVITNPLNLVAPAITPATVSGTASIGGGSFPTGSSLSALDTTTGPPTTTSSGFESLPSSGNYSFRLGTGDTYSFSLSMPVQILPSPAPAAFFFPAPVPLTGGALTMNTPFNPTFPAPPGPVTGVTISGEVVITGVRTPIAKAQVSATGTQLTGAANTYFFRSTPTDAFGNYSLVVPAGTNYSLFFNGAFFTSGDFDGDAKADLSIWRPSSGTWFVNLSDPNVAVQQWGTSGDIPVRGDFDGDGLTDYAVWRPSTGQWFVIPSKTPGSPFVQQWGTSGDIPVPGNYDGDGKTDYAVWRPSTGTWFIIPSSNPGTPIAQQWGTGGDIPVPGDYDGDGKTDYAVWRPSSGTWFIIPSGNPGTPIAQQWGTSGDNPVPGDYDGDEKADFAVWRPSSGTWFIIPSGNPGTPIVQQWGTNNDIPVPVDYDRDRKTDIAVWRPSNGTWYVIPSSAPGTSIVTQWGTSGDVPTQKPIG
jgi:hypothetical protein